VCPSFTAGRIIIAGNHTGKAAIIARAHTVSARDLHRRRAHDGRQSKSKDFVSSINAGTRLAPGHVRVNENHVRS
jgi:hypothetical protein